jgi:hypothetical protein
MSRPKAVHTACRGVTVYRAVGCDTNEVPRDAILCQDGNQLTPVRGKSELPAPNAVTTMPAAVEPVSEAEQVREPDVAGETPALVLNVEGSPGATLHSPCGECQAARRAASVGILPANVAGETPALPLNVEGSAGILPANVPTNVAGETPALPWNVRLFT